MQYSFLQNVVAAMAQSHRIIYLVGLLLTGVFSREERSGETVFAFRIYSATHKDCLWSSKIKSKR